MTSFSSLFFLPPFPVSFRFLFMLFAFSHAFLRLPFLCFLSTISASLSPPPLPMQEGLTPSSVHLRHIPFSSRTPLSPALDLLPPFPAFADWVSAKQLSLSPLERSFSPASFPLPPRLPAAPPPPLWLTRCQGCRQSKKRIKTIKASLPLISNDLK